MEKLKCKQCECYNYDFINDVYEEGSFCGLHGCAPIDLNGPQPNLDGHGSCGFIPKVVSYQLDLFDHYETE